jgi:hypothetical protein
MVKVKRKPRKCPQCGSIKVATILRGMPIFSEKLMTDISEGKVFLGGCCITENDPDWQCSECHMQFFKINSVDSKPHKSGEMIFLPIFSEMFFSILAQLLLIELFKIQLRI